MVLSTEDIVAFQTHIFSWWNDHRRDLPWRHTHNPYFIVVSELMLQQTQVLRVIEKYREFIERFPTVTDLAQASPADVLKLWKGLGYNRRALYLKKMAVVVKETYDGKFPTEEKQLLALPGLGKYTTRAVMVFAFKQDVSMIDTNIRQIIVHHFFSNIPQKESALEEVADQLVPKGKSWEWHQALMDYGSLHLPTIKPKAVRNTAASSIPFIETNRFIRGKLMDYARMKKWEEDHLVNTLIEAYARPREQVVLNLTNLVKEGLLEKQDEIIQLPE